MLGKEFGGEDALDTLLGPGCKVKAQFTIRGTIRVDGTLTGQINSADTLIVGKTGVVEADVKVKTVVVAGKILGNIKADMIKMQNGSHIEGDVETKRLAMDENVFFQGNCRMGTQITSGAKVSPQKASERKDPE